MRKAGDEPNKKITAQLCRVAKGAPQLFPTIDPRLFSLSNAGFVNPEWNSRSVPPIFFFQDRSHRCHLGVFLRMSAHRQRASRATRLTPRNSPPQYEERLASPVMTCRSRTGPSESQVIYTTPVRLSKEQQARAS